MVEILRFYCAHGSLLGSGVLLTRFHVVYYMVIKYAGEMQLIQFLFQVGRLTELHVHVDFGLQEIVDVTSAGMRNVLRGEVLGVRWPPNPMQGVRILREYIMSTGARHLY